MEWPRSNQSRDLKDGEANYLAMPTKPPARATPSPRVGVAVGGIGVRVVPVNDVLLVGRLESKRDLPADLAHSCPKYTGCVRSS